MTTDATRLRAVLDALGLSQTAAAGLLRLDGRTVRRYVAGDIDPVPAWVWERLAVEVRPPATDTDAPAALGPHVERLIHRATAAGWSEAEARRAIADLARGP